MICCVRIIGFSFALSAELAEVSFVEWFVFLLIINQCFVYDLFEVESVQTLGFCDLNFDVTGVKDFALVLGAAHHERFLKFVDAGDFCKENG